MINCRHRILPDQLFSRYLNSHIAGLGPHITVGQLEPGPGKGIGELIRVCQVITGNFFVNRVKLERQVCRGHHGATSLRRIMGINHHILVLNILGQPDIGTCRTLEQFPLILEHHLQVTHIPSGWIWFPGPFNAAGDSVAPFAALKAADPAQSLLLKSSGLRLRPDMIGSTGTVAFAKGMTTCNQGHGFFIVHGHPGKGLPDIMSRLCRNRLPIGPLRIDVDQAHLHRSQRIFKITFTAVALVSQPFVLSSPVDILLRLPDIFTATGKAEGLEAH